MAETTTKSTPAPKAPTTKSAPAPENIATAGDVVSGAAVPGTDPEAHQAVLEEVGSWDAKDHVIREGNFHDPALQGAGTILPDGSYGPPLPDPQVQRAKANRDYQVK